MKKVEISYNPYKMTTAISIDGIDVCKDSEHYDKFRQFIEDKIPLQTWIEPIPYRKWAGFVNELSNPEINDKVEVTFSGRDIDFEDLKRSIADQNDDRADHISTSRVIYHFEHKKILDDKKLSENIEHVVKELQSDRFRELMDQRSTESLTQKYKELEKNYKMAKETEFPIVIAGVYSSGKSTILNTIIRHDVLPTSSNTCTSKNCRIRHDSSLGKKLSLVCYDSEGNVAVEKRIFDNDADCANAFLEICPINSSDSDESDSENRYPNVSTMELGMDLSHLYPKSVSEDKFTIVLIDTPGMNSAQSEEDGSNKHAEIALNAISMKSKPMIILCVDGQSPDAKCIGEFMKEIVAQAKEEGSGFNDRFLFLMNKSDAIAYKKGENAKDKKIKFSKYLTNPGKWNIKEGEEGLKQIADEAAHFVPRIFMTSGLVAYAIQVGAMNFSDDEVMNDEFNLTLKNALEVFKKRITMHHDNYYLSRYCDIPNYRKDEIEKEFEEAINAGNDVRATELQCGLVSVESAIKDYIERYAYPIKVRALLETFEDILEDVKTFSSSYGKTLQRKIDELGEKRGERKEVGKTKETTEGKIVALTNARNEVDRQLKKLDDVKFDKTSLTRSIHAFKNEIYKDSEVVFLRAHSKVPTGQKSRNEVENEINMRTNHIKSLFDSTLRKTNGKLKEIKEAYDQQLRDIFNVLQHTITELENSGIFEQGEYCFKDSVFWKMSLKNIDADSFASNIRKSIVEKELKTKVVLNPKKIEWRYSWNPFKKVGSIFLSESITESYYEDGYYTTTDFVKRLDEYMQNLTIESAALEDSFKKAMEASKSKVRDLADSLIGEFKQFLHDIEKQEARIQSVCGSMDKLQEEIDELNATLKWLNDLAEKIKGV